jgi:hypothetical protein
MEEREFRGKGLDRVGCRTRAMTTALATFEVITSISHLERAKEHEFQQSLSLKPALA